MSDTRCQQAYSVESGWISAEDLHTDDEDARNAEDVRPCQDQATDENQQLSSSSSHFSTSSNTDSDSSDEPNRLHYWHLRRSTKKRFSKHSTSASKLQILSKKKSFTMGNLEKSETSITKVSNTDEDEDSRTNLNKVGLPSNKTSKGEEATGVNRQEIDESRVDCWRPRRGHSFKLFEKERKLVDRLNQDSSSTSIIRSEDDKRAPLTITE